MRKILVPLYRQPDGLHLERLEPEGMTGLGAFTPLRRAGSLSQEETAGQSAVRGLAGDLAEADDRRPVLVKPKGLNDHVRPVDGQERLLDGLDRALVPGREPGRDERRVDLPTEAGRGNPVGNRSRAGPGASAGGALVRL